MCVDCLGISKPRVARDGTELPNARLVSTTVHSDMNIPDVIHPLLLMTFGQFLDHDMSRTAISTIASSTDGLFVSLFWYFSEIWAILCFHNRIWTIRATKWKPSCVGEIRTIGQFGRIWTIFKTFSYSFTKFYYPISQLILLWLCVVWLQLPCWKMWNVERTAARRMVLKTASAIQSTCRIMILFSVD